METITYNGITIYNPNSKNATINAIISILAKNCLVLIEKDTDMPLEQMLHEARAEAT